MQKMTHSKKVLLFILCIVLITAIALFTTACNGSQTDGETTTISPVSTTESPITATVLGDGELSFNFTVTDAEGNETAFLINTDKTFVGDALVELELIAGDESEYGLYVKTVNGITVDYDTDGKYWAFYIDGQYASTGVDSTEIVDGATYSFKVE